MILTNSRMTHQCIPLMYFQLLVFLMYEVATLYTLSGRLHYHIAFAGGILKLLTVDGLIKSTLSKWKSQLDSCL